MDAPLDSTPVSSIDEAIRLTAPGTALRHALDMIIAGNLGALICVGDSKKVLEAGNDGFPLNISFTANRLFGLSKMDGAIVIDRDLTQIMRANFHLNPDPSLPTTETGMRHRTAARMSLLTNAMVISVSERRQVVHIYFRGESYQLRTVAELTARVSQLLATLQTTRQALDRSLLRLTSLELDNYVTLADIANIYSQFELLMVTDEHLQDYIAQLGCDGRTVEMQRMQLIGDMDNEYSLMIRDYASDSSIEAAQRIRKRFSELSAKNELDIKNIASVLGYPDRREDNVMVPLGLRTLSRISVVREGMADKIVDEYGSLQDLLDDIKQNPERLDEIGVRNSMILADSLLKMHERQQ